MCGKRWVCLPKTIDDAPQINCVQARPQPNNSRLHIDAEDNCSEENDVSQKIDIHPRNGRPTLKLGAIWLCEFFDPKNCCLYIYISIYLYIIYRYIYIYIYHYIYIAELIGHHCWRITWMRAPSWNAQRSGSIFQQVTCPNSRVTGRCWPSRNCPHWHQNHSCLWVWMVPWIVTGWLCHGGWLARACTHRKFKGP